jgi:hypothetical protein
MDKKLQDLIEKRKKLINSIELNELNMMALLTGQYNDPSHFIYEILQNAEDAKAKKISFTLNEKELVINHNGRDFNFDDVKGITSIGDSGKKEDINAIGKFGVGFKSVFAITETPKIYSGKYNFEIQEFFLPKVLKKYPNNQNTRIIIPFNHRARNKDLAYKIVENKLENLKPITLLFLTNIESIVWNSKSKEGIYIKRSKTFKGINNIKCVEILSKNGDEESLDKYIVIYKNIQIDKKPLKLEVSYKVEKNNGNSETIVPIEDAKLIVFFPTEKITFLNFLIQGPFKTTPNRENIPLDDEQNNYLIEKIAELTAESLPIIKKLNLLNIDFLQILPLKRNHSNEIIYTKIFERIIEEFLNGEELLPTSKSSFSKPEDSLLARGKELTTFLNKSDINFLFGKKNWLNPGITTDKTSNLRDYIVDELNVEVKDFSDFARKISNEFLKRKTDNWIIDFYRRLLDQQKLWEKTDWNDGFLRRKPIIRLIKNEHIAPFDEDGRIQVYLPSNHSTKYKTVKATLIKKKKSLEFLKKLGLSKPDIFSEIKEFILPKYLDSKVIINKDYYQDIKKIFETYKSISKDKKKELIEELKKLKIISCSNLKDNKKILKEPSGVYLNNSDLLKFFNKFEEVYFIDEKILELIADEEFLKLIVEIGCNEIPRKIIIDSNLSFGIKTELRNGIDYSYDVEEVDYDLEGLDNFLTEITQENSVLLWNMLLNIIESNNSSSYFKGKYTWRYRRYEYSAEFDSKFLKTLKNNAWIYDLNGESQKPISLSPLDLNQFYRIDKKNSDFLIEILGFIPDPIKQYEERTGSKLITREEYEEYKALKAEKEKELGEEVNEEWIPEIKPDSIRPVLKENELPHISFPALEYRDINVQVNAVKNDESREKDTDNKKEIKDSKKIKKIGKWGEELVFEHFKKRFSNYEKIEEIDLGFKLFSREGNIVEIKWLNKSKDEGVGYDFVIIKDGKEIEYIEVKSKVSNEAEMIEITGTQWEFARKLYNDGNGDKYYIYVVKNAGTKDAAIQPIKNPISLWYSGRLYAHPVRFKL